MVPAIGIIARAGAETSFSTSHAPLIVLSTASRAKAKATPIANPATTAKPMFRVLFGRTGTLGGSALSIRWMFVALNPAETFASLRRSSRLW